MTLDDLPLVQRRFIFGGKSVVLTAVDDQEVLLRQSQNREPLPFGMLLWESAVVLADAVVCSISDVAPVYRVSLQRCAGRRCSPSTTTPSHSSCAG
jgi:hypothetical protein